MRWIKWIGFVAAIVLLVSCFTTWASLPARNISISGVDATGTSFGKPGYLHLVLGSLLSFFILFPGYGPSAPILWSPLLISHGPSVIFFLSPPAGAGECPEKHTGIYLVMITSFLLLLAALFPDMKLPDEEIRNEEPKQA